MAFENNGYISRSRHHQKFSILNLHDLHDVHLCSATPNNASHLTQGFCFRGRHPFQLTNQGSVCVWGKHVQEKREGCQQQQQQQQHTTMCRYCLRTIAPDAGNVCKEEGFDLSNFAGCKACADAKAAGTSTAAATTDGDWRRQRMPIVNINVARVDEADGGQSMDFTRM